MKRIATTARLSVMALLLLLIGWAPAANAQGIGSPINVNGSFELSEPGEKTGYDIEGWLIEVGESVPAPPTFTVVEDENAPDGDHVLRIDVADIGASAWNIQIVADSLPVIPGQSYRMTLWARSTDPFASAAFTVGNYAFNEYGRLGGIILTTEWQEYTLDFTIGDDQTVIRAPLHFNFDGNIDNPVYIDHLQIVRTSVTSELARPIIVEAESGEVGAEFDVIEEDTTTFVRVVTDWWDFEGPGQPQWSRPMSPEHMITFDVTFPAPGTYNLFARVRVQQQDQEGRTPPSNDSFFFPMGFGERSHENVEDWRFVNQLDAAAGWTEPDNVVHDRGTAGAAVWKWVNISNNTYGAEGIAYDVPAGQLNQTFQIAGRETYLDIDKIAFGLQGLYYTVRDLDTGAPGSIEWPQDRDPVDFYEGPPLATGHQKYLGNIYSPSQVTSTPPVFEHYWNQVTPENEGKWGSVQPANNPDRSTWSWGALDNAYNLAKDNGFAFRFHVLVWGSQQPNWMNGLSEEEQLAAVRNWFEAVAERYPDIDVLEVVNEPIPQPPPYREALGGTGDTGWDWIITAFEMAREVFPEHTRLMLNDYGILNGGNKTTQYLGIINLLNDRGLIDVIGVQGHHFTLQNITPATLRNTIDRLAATGLPVVVTELDIAGRPTGNENINDPDYPLDVSDQTQLEVYQRVFPVIWEHEAIEGVTLWGWKLGSWRPGRQMHLVRANGSERPALTWLREYMAETATSVEAVEIPQSVALFANYPNPFSRSTQLGYELAAPVHVRLEVYDMLGRHVRTLVSGPQAAGTHSVTFDAAGLPSGVYFYRLRAGEHVQSRQMMLVR